MDTKFCYYRGHVMNKLLYISTILCVATAFSAYAAPAAAVRVDNRHDAATAVRVDNRHDAAAAVRVDNRHDAVRVDNRHDAAGAVRVDNRHDNRQNARQAGAPGTAQGKTTRAKR